MLLRVQRKGNPSALLVRLQTGAVCGYSRVLKTLKIELQYDRTTPLLGINPHPHPPKNKHTSLKRHMYPYVHGGTIYNMEDMEAV